MSRIHRRSMPESRPFFARSGKPVGVLGTLGLAVAAAGCEPSTYDPRLFDELRDSAWVHSTEAPSGLDAQRFGLAIGSGGMNGSDGAGFFVAARQTDGFAYLRYAPNGNLVTAAALPLIGTNGVNTAESPNPMPTQPLMASDPGSAQVAVALSNGGSADAPMQSTLAILDAGTGTPAGLIPLEGPPVVSGLAFGVSDARAAATTNLVVARGDLLSLVVDVSMPANTERLSCQHGGMKSLGLAVAELHTIREGSEIAIVKATTALPAEVVITQGSTVADAAMADPTMIGPCFDVSAARQPLATIAAPGGEEDFGTRLLTADFNGNGTTDLVATAPGTGRVYVYLDIDLAAGTPAAPLTITAPAGASDFGQTLAVGDISGDGQDELFVAAPGTGIAGANVAGAVYLYQLGDGGAFGEPLMLHDAQPEGNERFGQSVAVVPFGADRAIVVIGSDSEVYTYFRTPVSSDVRP